MTTPILDLGKQDAYAEYRRQWREQYLQWLDERELPGTPQTPMDGDELGIPPITADGP